MGVKPEHGSFVKMKRSIRETHAFVMQRTPGIGGSDMVWLFGSMFGEQSTAPLKDVTLLLVTLQEWSPRKKPVDPRSNDEDKILEYVTSLEEYEQHRKSLYRHECTTGEIMYLLQLFDNHDLRDRHFVMEDVMLEQMQKFLVPGDDFRAINTQNYQ